MTEEKWVVTDADIIRAREDRYHGWNDLTTEGALAWSLPKHSHPLNEIHVGKCTICAIERRALDAYHCATRAKGEPWWEEWIAAYHAELHTMFQGPEGFSWTDVRVSLPDGRWWVARAFDSTGRNLSERGEERKWSAELLQRREGGKP
jgi:hypothetical protein